MINAESLSPCPDCAEGKHRNCHGDTWDHDLDNFAPCPCAEAGHVAQAMEREVKG